MFYGLAFLVSLALLAFCVLDCMVTDPSTVRILPKAVWVMLIIFLPVAGPAAWLLLGRPGATLLKPSDARIRVAPPPAPSRPKRPLGPDDDPRFQEMTRKLIPPAAAQSEGEPEKRPEVPGAGRKGQHGGNELKAWEQDLLRREEELRRREGDTPGD